MLKKLMIGLVLLVALVACGQDTNTPAPSATLPQVDQASSTIPPSPLPASATPSPSSTATPEPTPTLTPAPVFYGPNNYPASVNPLTGLTVSDPSLLDRRPLAYKINLVPRTYYRPPWGLSFADIVYDYYHNDGYSRLHAIFYGQDAELVGAIRSGRLLDQELIRMYQSIFGYGSADEIVNSRLLNAEYSYRVFLEGQAASCPPTATTPFCRYDPANYNLLLSSTSALSEYATAHGVDNVRQNLEGMSFADVTPTGGTPGTQVFVRYSGDNYTRWDYDPASGSYLHFQDEVYDQGSGEEYSPLIDRLNNEQISAENVVVLLVRHEYLQQPPAEIVDILLSGQGKAYAFRDGQRYELTWNRPGLNTPLFLTYPDGTAWSFKPGQTWFQVVGTSSLISQEGDSGWRFVHWMP
jgi:hypothetical protein